MTGPATTRPATRTVTLSAPLQAGETTITEVVLHRPTVGHLRGCKLQDILQLDVSAHAVLWSRIAPELTPALIDQLDPADLAALAGATVLFFATPQQLSRATAQMAAES
jgi:hypothetical protein